MSRLLLIAGASAAVLTGAALLVTAPWAVTTRTPEVIATGTGEVAVDRGDAAASCAFLYSTDTLQEAGFAFEGTVTRIDTGGILQNNTVSFQVDRWFRGGDEPEVDLQLVAPVQPGDTTFDSAQADVPSYTVGSRLLIAGATGHPVTPGGRLAWPCGFIRYSDAESSEAWQAVLGAD